MTDPLSRFEALRRPAILIKAAQAGAAGYKRAEHLPRTLAFADELVLPTPAAALDALLDHEDGLNSERRRRSAHYSCFTHIEVLIAMIAEAQALVAARYETAAE